MIMQIRHLDGTDEVRDLIRAHGLAWREAYDGVLPSEILRQQSVDPTEDERRQWQAELSENEEGVLVAVDAEGTVRGFIDVRWGEIETKPFVGDDEASLKAIYIHPDWWNQSIGTALLERGLKLLPESIDTVRLEMLAGNEIGRRFYESKGFERTKTGTHEIGGESYPTIIYALQL
jgi:ribosomal protein S18 acetylase RimI-like enzyme